MNDKTNNMDGCNKYWSLFLPPAQPWRQQKSPARGGYNIKQRSMFSTKLFVYFCKKSENHSRIIKTKPNQTNKSKSGRRPSSVCRSSLPLNSSICVPHWPSSFQGYDFDCFLSLLLTILRFAIKGERKFESITSQNKCKV